MHVQVLLLASILALTACAPSSMRAKVGGQEIIKDFKVSPDRAKIKLGEQIRLSFSLSKDGFLTLFTTDSDRSTYELERNVKVNAGKLEFPRSDDRDAAGAKAAYVIAEPIGKQLVYLAFTSNPIPEGIRLKGVLTEKTLEQRLREALELAGGPRDVASLEFEVVK